MSLFGSNTTSQPAAFGSASKPSFSFGSTNTATTSTAGFGFGTTTSSGFGTAPSTGFGAFGAPAASTATPFGGLGAAATSTAPSLFGANTFGSTAAKPATGFGAGFGTSTFGASTFGQNVTPFGATNTFGTTQPTPAFGTNTLGGNTFGNSNTFGNNSLNFGVAKPNTGFSGFGTGLGIGLGTNQFGQPQQQQQQQQGPATAQEALVAAVFNCCVFGDERDEVLAKWNLLQAKWGTGQAFYNRNAPPLELNSQNPLCRFKAVGYSKLAGRHDRDGHVAMLFNNTEQEMKTNQQNVVNALQNLLGNKPNLAVTVESVKAISESKCQLVIYVVDKNANNSHVSATELSNFLNSGAAKTALAGAGCNAAAPVTKPSPQALAQYLNTAPPGMDMRLWKQAQADNPDPANYIPVPMVGFSEIKFRASCQAEQARLQAEWLRRTEGELCSLRSRRAAAAARLTHAAAAHHRHRHLLMQIIANAEVVGRVGAALSPEEEATRARLQELASQLSTPPLYNGRLNEMLCAVRLQRSASGGAQQERYHLDPGAQEDVKQFLSLQQKGMAHLLDTARKDLAALALIEEGMDKLVRA